MSIQPDDSKHISLSMNEIERLCPVAKALSSPMRVKMIGLLCSRSMNVNELADALSLPVSTAALNVRQLEEAGLITTEIQPGIRGAMKLCSQRIDSVSMRLTPEMEDGVSALTVRLPIGSYSSAAGVRSDAGVADVLGGDVYGQKGEDGSVSSTPVPGADGPANSGFGGNGGSAGTGGVWAMVTVVVIDGNTGQIMPDKNPQGMQMPVMQSPGTQGAPGGSGGSGIAVAYWEE